LSDKQVAGDLGSSLHPTKIYVVVKIHWRTLEDTAKLWLEDSRLWSWLGQVASFTKSGQEPNRRHDACKVTALLELRTSIGNNRHLIPNYGQRYRHGEAIATGFVESTVNQVVSKRFCKK